MSAGTRLQFDGSPTPILITENGTYVRSTTRRRMFGHLYNHTRFDEHVRIFIVGKSSTPRGYVPLMKNSWIRVESCRCKYRGGLPLSWWTARAISTRRAPSFRVGPAMGNIIIPLPYSGGQSSELWNKPTPALVEPGNGEQVVSTVVLIERQIIPIPMRIPWVRFHTHRDHRQECSTTTQWRHDLSSLWIGGWGGLSWSTSVTTQNDTVYQGTHNSNHQTAYERTDENTVIPNTNSPTKATTIPNTKQPTKAPTKVPIPKTNEGSYEGTDNSTKKGSYWYTCADKNTHKSTDKNKTDGCIDGHEDLRTYTRWQSRWSTSTHPGSLRI